MQIGRNDAGKCVRAMAKSGWKDAHTVVKGNGDDEEGLVDLGQVAADQIAKMIKRLYSGHGLARLGAMNARRRLPTLGPGHERQPGSSRGG